MRRSHWWPKDGSAEWLNRVDGDIAVLLVQHLQSRRGATGGPLEPVLEVGVWKGAWVSVLLMNTSVEKIYGVDPYPNLDEIRTLMLSRLARLNIDDRFDLYDSLEDLPADQTYSLIHLDGEHSEFAVERELRFAADHLAKSGIIIVDDFRNFWFPGVSSAVFRSLEVLGLRLFASSESKAYLSRSSDAEDLYAAITQVCEEGGLSYSTMFDSSGTVVPYTNATTVLGQPVLLISGRTPQSTRFRAQVRRVLPPVVADMIVDIRKRLRSLAFG